MLTLHFFLIDAWEALYQLQIKWFLAHANGQDSWDHLNIEEVLHVLESLVESKEKAYINTEEFIDRQGVMMSKLSGLETDFETFRKEMCGSNENFNLGQLFASGLPHVCGIVHCN